MDAISKEFILRSDAQLAAKWPHVKPTPAQQEEAAFRATEDATYASWPSFSSAPSSSSGVEASLAAIMDQLQHMSANFGSHLDHLFDEICQMNTRIGCIACRQSHLGGFAYSPFPEPAEESSDGGDDESDDASGSPNDNEMTVSQ